MPEGGFFVVSSTEAHSGFETGTVYADAPGPKGESPVTRDWAFARWLTVEHGVTSIPMSAFYTVENAKLAANLSRFAFCKTDKALDEGGKRLTGLLH